MALTTRGPFVIRKLKPWRQQFCITSLELPLHMALMATWEITITRREGSRLRFSEQRGSAPQKRKIVEMADAGTSIKARIDTYSEERFKASGLDYFQVMATET
jgi:hypothetical protein